MRRKFSIPAFQLAVAMLAASAQATSFTYVNARFGTTCTFPDDVFTDRQPEPENGDGQEWLSADGASLICSGILNIDNDTPKGFVTAEKADNGPAYKITYSKTGKDRASRTARSSTSAGSSAATVSSAPCGSNTRLP